jgi:hypothetical protein
MGKRKHARVGIRMWKPCGISSRHRARSLWIFPPARFAACTYASPLAGAQRVRRLRGCCSLSTTTSTTLLPASTRPQPAADGDAHLFRRRTHAASPASCKKHAFERCPRGSCQCPSEPTGPPRRVSGLSLCVDARPSICSSIVPGHSVQLMCLLVYDRVVLNCPRARG